MQDWKYVHKGSDEYMSLVGLIRNMFRVKFEDDIQTIATKGSEVRIKTKNGWATLGQEEVYEI
jgi:hypothetical protein